MNIDHRRLKAAVAVADELSFSRAAARLSITQPALSAQVHNLEKAVGFRLFDRSTRRVELTEHGAQFLREARRLLEEYERLSRFVRVLRRQQQAHLAIGAAIYTIDFSDRVRLLDGLIEACADIEVEVVTSGSQTEITRQLSAGQLDLAILMGVPVASAEYQRALAVGAGREVLFDEGLRTVVLARRPVTLLVPEESPLARRRQISRRALAGQPVAIFHPNHGDQLYRPLARHLEAAGAQLVQPPEPNAIGVERYGRHYRIPAVTLGWFPEVPEGRMIRKTIAGLGLSTALVLAAQPGASSPAIEQALAFAQDAAGRS